ncbi:keratin-associated protein 10-2-like [Monomorium pharaonis]|uniref:keratin-associated protein 10-2-like n=1 Tax=Monomorium pharaonis TaxID=307658 RepID=UPI00063F0748|nr:keratin-associated protein 10-2-like [Monomorium pharaonis]
MDKSKQKRNFMDEMLDIICEIERLKPEPEECNVSCPPLGCPQGPCPGMCCSKGICDPCCASKMPCAPSSPRPSHCCMPRRLKDYACSTDPCTAALQPIIISRGGPTARNSSYPIPHDQSGFQQAFCPPAYNFISTVLPPCTVGSVSCWNN